MTPATVTATRRNIRAIISSTDTKSERDHYYKTPPSCTHALLDREIFIGDIWEPACGDGAISTVLTERGYKTISTDLVDRGFAQGRIDFLMECNLLAPNVVTNPPFKLADEFVLHAFHLGAKKIAILQRLAWIEGSGRHASIWSKTPPVRVYPFSKRQTLWRGDDPYPGTTGGAICFAWFVFERGFVGHPELRWIA